jgi:hypothetical protein
VSVVDVAPAPRVGDVRISLRMLAGLFAGRAAFRVVLYGANVAMLQVWDHATYAAYAAASGALVWLLALAQAGPEKAALKLLPRPGEARAAVLDALLTTVRVVPLAGLATAATAIALDPDATATLYVVCAAQSVAIGLNVAAVAIQRALGRAERDIRNFAVLSAAWIVLSAAAAALRVEPVLYVFALCAAAVVVTHVGTHGLTGSARTGAAAPGLGRTVALMSAYDVAGVAAVSVAFLVLSLTSAAEQAGPLYLAVGGWSILLGFIVYGVRVFVPRISLWMQAEGRVLGPRRARAMARWALGANIAWLAAVGLLIVLGRLPAVSPGLPCAGVLTVLLLSRGPMCVLTFLSVSLLENADARTLRRVAAGAVGGLALVVVVSVPAIPAFGAYGAVWALAMDELVLAAVLLRR